MQMVWKLCSYITTNYEIKWDFKIKNNMTWRGNKIPLKWQPFKSEFCDMLQLAIVAVLKRYRKDF